MAPTKTGKVASAADKTKKEKVYHPQSRKAGQLARKALRKGKMGSQASVRGKKHHHLGQSVFNSTSTNPLSLSADVYNFFYSCLPETGELCLDELHAIVRDIWLTRHDDELSEEQAARRKGRPKSVKEAKLEEVKLRESEEYRTGMGESISRSLPSVIDSALEVIDLTHPPTVELFRRWDQKEVAFIQLLRFIRISSANPDSVVVSKPGKHHTIVGSAKPPIPANDDDAAPQLIEVETQMVVDD